MSLYKGSTCIARTTNVSGKANTWLDNLTDVGEDRLNTSKMYLTGSVSTDEKGYNQLLEMKHSTSSKSGIDIVNINNAEVEIPYTLSKTGSKIVDVAYRDKVIELYEQEGQADYFTIDEVNKNFTLPMGEIYGMAVRKDLSNLSEVGEKHFLNKQQITNCLTEVPQRIKYDLTDGTLTIKAGSVVIVPYGTEDLTTQYPIGSTFLHENFKVYDTQFVDGKFFVWAELLIDITRSSFGSNGTILGFINFNNAGNLGDVAIGQALSSNVGSGTSDPNTGYYYRTDENKVYISGNWYGYSLPIIEAIANGTTVTSVQQIFNGMGFIGSTVWIDKGVTAVCGQGCNADGTIKNATYKHSGIELVDLSAWDALTNSFAGYLIYVVSSSRNNFWFQPYARFYTSTDPIGSSNSVQYSYVEKERQWYVWDGDSNKQYWEKAQVYIYAEMTTKGNKAFKPKPPFRAADYNDIDGEYTLKKRLVVSSKEDLSVASGVNVNYNLSEFLPKDNNSYLVLTHLTVQTGASAGAYCHVWTTSSDSVEGISCGGNTTSAARQTFISKGWTLVRPDRILRTFRSCSGSAGILYTLDISAYRKVR